jgi:hypothetical protein
MDVEEKIAKWERITLRLAGFVALVIIILVTVTYTAVEGVKFIWHRFAG